MAGTSPAMTEESHCEEWYNTKPANLNQSVWL